MPIPQYDPNMMPQMAPIASQMGPVDPHAALTAPIGPPKPDVPTMAAKPVEPKMSALKPVEEKASKKLAADYAKDEQPENAFLRGLGNVGQVLAPHLMSRIPGTRLFRQAEEQGLEKKLGDVSKEESTENLQGAQAGKAQADVPYEAAQTENLLHPKDQFTPVPTQSGIESFSRNTGSASPVKGENGQTLMPYTKPGPRQHVFLQGPGGTPVAATFDPQSGTYFDAHDVPIPNPMPYEKPTAPQHITVMLNGKPHVMGSDAQGNFTRDLGEAPPTYAGMMPEVLGARTTSFIDPETGLPTEKQFNPKTGTYDRPLGLSASNAYGHEAAQAGAVERAGENVIADLEANRAKLGNLGAWVSKYGLNTPIADPTLQGIQTELASFAALNPAMHGARGTEAMKHFEQLIGGLQQNPDATIAGIRSIIHTAGAINPGTAQQIHQQAPAAPKPGDIVKGWKFIGGDPHNRASWEKQ